MFIIGMPILMAITAIVMPTAMLNSLPSLASYLFASGTAVGAITAVVLNLVIPPVNDSAKDDLVLT